MDMTIMDEVITQWLANDTSDASQYCNGFRVDTKDELTVKFNETETPIERWRDDEQLVIDFEGGGDVVIK